LLSWCLWDIIRPLNEFQNNFETEIEEEKQIQFVEVAGIALTGGSNGTTNLQTRIPNYLRKIRNYTWQCTCPSGRRVGWQWTDERQKQLVRDFVRRLRDENGKYVQVAMARLPAGRLLNTLITKVA